MPMSLTSFRTQYAERLLDLLWAQWSRLGVFAASGDPGGAEAGATVLDPEALLLASFELGRQDPRLYDEVLSWLAAHGTAVNLQRLANVAARQPGFDRSLLAAPAAWLQANTSDKRWKRLAGEGKAGGPEPFFLDPQGPAAPRWGAADPEFLRAGWQRGAVRLRESGGGSPPRSGPCLWLVLRRFFGLNVRADILVYLLTHDSAHPSELAREVHYSQPSLFQVCRELEESGAVQGFRQGNQHRYRLEADRWRDFLGLEGLRWTPWAAVFHFHQGLWRFFFRREWEGVSAYLQASEFREALRESLRAAGAGSLAADFQKVLAIPGEAFLPAARQQLLDSLARAGSR